MKHVFVVFNNDAALFACATKDVADHVIARETERIRKTLTRTSSTPKELELRMLENNLYWRMIPYATIETGDAKRKQVSYSAGNRQH